MSELLINDIKSNNSELKSYNEGMQIIEEMAEVLKNYTERNYIMASHVILECYAEELYSKNYRKQEWISVKDRLPEGKVNCLVHYKHSYCDNDGYWAIGVSFYDGNEFHIGLEYKITHWMPLPPPPKENKND